MTPTLSIPSIRARGVLLWFLWGGLALAAATGVQTAEGDEPSSASSTNPLGRRWHADIAEAKQAALASGRPIMVVFR